MRGKFEALQKVVELLNEYSDEIVFNDDKNEYEAPSYKSWIPEYVYELNFGWYAFQEQEKRIEEIKSKVQDIWTELDDRQSKEYIIEKCEEIIQELLK